MKSPCDIVADRVALGEPLGDLADHAASCASCRRIAALPTDLASTRVEADPGLGFSARMTAGAQQRITVRRRRRIAMTLAATVAAGVLGVVVVTRDPETPMVSVNPPREPTPTTQPKDPKDHEDPWKDPKHDNAGDEDVKALLRLANVERSSHWAARWKRIERPLAPYRALVKGLIEQ
ncbi:MAG: hypothetical protein JWO36_3463 [Myxococcales bacterium]|nr:hypothetical protein [Myxococcales bacterium]